MGRLRYPMTISIVKIYVPLWRGVSFVIYFLNNYASGIFPFSSRDYGIFLNHVDINEDGVQTKSEDSSYYRHHRTGIYHNTRYAYCFLWLSHNIFFHLPLTNLSLGHGWGVVFGCCRWFRVLFFLRYDMSSTFHKPLKQSQSNGIPSLTKLHCWIKEHRLLVENVRTYRPKNKYWVLCNVIWIN